MSTAAAYQIEQWREGSRWTFHIVRAEPAFRERSKETYATARECKQAAETALAKRLRLDKTEARTDHAAEAA